ncbi:MAG: 16S rRNA (uracil(1498)-N(3))-methyltransferase [Candidatus Taylorbacteria bacterium]|nr:16S rRNA (uracil(1498)-N(3))-methyltransferase [Candidatus Taylorbacteria bacterium]
MKVHRFYLAEPLITKVGQPVEIRDSRLVHQWHQVLRLQAGERLVLIDGSGFDYPAQIIKIKKTQATVMITGKEKNSAEPKRGVTLFQSIIKKDNFEWIVQKGTELGVSKFVPIISERSEKKSLNMERLLVIAMEAVEQSGRSKLPIIDEPIHFARAVELSGPDSVVFDASGSPFSTFNLKLSTYNLFIGPEGGWSEKELEIFKNHKVAVVSLGLATLRAETAAIAAISLISLQ